MDNTVHGAKATLCFPSPRYACPRHALAALATLCLPSLHLAFLLYAWPALLTCTWPPAGNKRVQRQRSYDELLQWHGTY
jgi:hypothetical protein